MQTVVATRIAFKEWAVTCRALAEGKQILLVRKGGIREEGRAFRVEHPQFLLYPTYEHQRADLLQPAYRADLDAALAETPPTGAVRLQYWAEVTDVYRTLEAAEVEALAPYFIHTTTYAAERLRWQPKNPLYFLLLRVYRLPEAHQVPVLASYLGCKSWVELDQPISLEGMVPVLDDAAYASTRTAIQATLGR